MSRVYKVRLEVSGWVDIEVVADSETKAIDAACEAFDDYGHEAQWIVDESISITDTITINSREPTKDDE